MSGLPEPPRPSPFRWVPVRVRQNAWLLVGAVLVVGLVALLLGTVQIRPIVFTKDTPEVPTIGEDVRGSVDFFDPSVAHTIDVKISDVEYQKMKEDYQSKGEKTWIRADVVVDGTLVPSVGIRLKGNSTLMPLRGARGPNGPNGPGMPGAPGASSQAMAWPSSSAVVAPPAPGSSSAPSSAAPSSSASPSAAPAGPSMSNVSFEDASTLPLVLRFDKFVKGRGFQGRSELAVRPVVGTSGAALNEAVALQLIAESGQISQKFSWVTFTMNGASSRTRLVLENPDQSYAQSLGRGAGALFKSKATNAFSYKGEDPTAYTSDFDQLSGKGSLDLAPVIALLELVDRGDDARFDAELSQRVDVESFARYVATHELLDNFDDMSGPGRNFLLWFDAGDRRFTVITWDMNLAITGMGGGSGGPGGPGGPSGPGGSFPFPAGSGRPNSGPGAPGFPTGPGGQMGRDGAGRPGGPGGGMRMGNKLKSRFLASAATADVRARERARLVASWFESGRAFAVTRELAARVPLTDKLDRKGVEAETEAVLAKLHRLAESAAKPASSAAKEPSVQAPPTPSLSASPSASAAGAR